MTIGGLASTMGTYNTYLFTTSTALQAIAKDGMAPSIFNALPQYKTPVVAIIFFSLTTAGLVLLDFSVLVEIESLLYCTHALLLCSSVIRLRFIEPKLERPFALPGGKVGVILITLPPILVLLGVIATLFYNGWLFPLISLGVLFAGALVYITKEMIQQKFYKTYGEDTQEEEEEEQEEEPQ